jgi:eukaryotic-like serine/threonine-protein kinase
MTSPLQLIEKISQGSNSTVYRAIDSRFGGEVAVKFCESALGDALASERFQREFQLAQRLTGLHAVKVFESGITSEGRWYYSMELVRGLTLAQVLESGRLPDGRTLAILKQACEFLRELHNLGLVHRDLKPTNMMLTWTNAAELLKVFDWGLMLTVLDRPTGTTLSGTPHYIAPESVQNPSQIDCRSDIYSLGCVAYHLLAGATPFQGNNPLQICAKQVRETAPPLGSLAGVAIAGQLSDLIMRCMAKDPQERPQQIEELAEELNQIEPLVAWSGTNVQRWWSDRKSLGDLASQ